MSNLFFLLVLLGLPFICEAQQNNVIMSQDSAWSETGNIFNASQEVIIKVNPSLPNYRITLRISELSEFREAPVKRYKYELKVYSLGSDQPVQTVKDTVNHSNIWIGNNQDYKNEFPDINFDGYSDLPIALNSDVIGNYGYDFWLFDKNTKKFHYSEEFSKLYNPFINPDKKIIVTVIRYTCQGHRCGTSKEFEVLNHSKLVLVKRENTSIETIDSKDYLINVYEELKGDVIDTVRIDTTNVKD